MEVMGAPAQYIVDQGSRKKNFFCKLKKKKKKNKIKKKSLIIY